MPTWAEFDAARIKHLEFIQSVISRLGSNGFLMKGWALTVAGAFYGFALNSHNRWLALAGILPTLAFWGLDAYFLSAERLFRKLYDLVRGDDTRVEPFYMGATAPDFVKELSPEDRQQVSWTTSLWRPALRYFYGAIIVSALLVFAIVLSTHSVPGHTPIPGPSTHP